MRKTTRRAFTTALSAIPIAGSHRALADQSGQKKRVITSASVPDDPDAPEVQEGTQPEVPPFGDALQFERQEVPLKVVPFAVADVRLLPSPFLSAQNANAAWLHSLPADRLVHNFRVNAGLASSAQPLGGWEKPDCELRGHFVGHYLSACALMSGSGGDSELRERGNQIVSELAICQRRLSGGYLSAFPIEFIGRLTQRQPVWAPFYTIHKIMAGLLDMHQLTGNTQALEVLTGMAEWTDQWSAAIAGSWMQMILDTEYGGMNEVLYNLAAVKNDDRFATVGDRFTKQRFFNPLALRRDDLRGLHTNTHIPQVIGAARRYEISGDPRFRDVASYFCSEIIEARAYATGGTSNNEGWLVQPNRLAAELAAGHDTTECCCAYNMLKLARQLYTWNGDPRYFDYYERVLYNHRLGAIHPETGTTQYYLGIVPGSWRTFGTQFDSFWCCNGTGAEEFSKLNNSIYFRSGDALYVNLFIASELNWRDRGVRIRQETTFPEESRTRLALTLNRPIQLAVNLRIPAWVASPPVIRINGEQVAATGTPSSYVSLKRTWKSGDAIELSLPMAIRAEVMPDDSSLAAICCGPLVLAGRVAGEQGKEIGPMGPDLKKLPPPALPALKVRADSPAASIRAADRALTFRVPAQTREVELAPFYRAAGQRYSIYWRLAS